jgi:ABC-type phosphate transport system auxiliary subunit
MASSTSDNATPKGEPWVWFTSVGLLIGLSMVAGLLVLVLVNGFSVFWAPQVPTVKLKDGTEIVGQFVQRRILPLFQTDDRHDFYGVFEPIPHQPVQTIVVATLQCFGSLL